MALYVKTYVAPSPIEGIGLFAAESIAKGTVVWRYDPPIDQTLSREFVEVQIETIRDFIIRYAYFDTKLKAYVLCGDNARFMNHADKPNLDGAYPVNERAEGINIACRNIAVGEEITCDYGSFDTEMELKLKLDQRNMI